ncbi:MAG: hypothetical protein JWM63_1101, partial [Gammaproteobacteria bacterium]|nr:hypothetical protein [Gammaproteobacteria bacterium]
MDACAAFPACHDALTALANRLGLRSKREEILQAATRAGTSIAVLLIALDRFKHVKDTLGHDAGDELLVEIARRLRDTVRHPTAVEAAVVFWSQADPDVR